MERANRARIGQRGGWARSSDPAVFPKVIRTEHYSIYSTIQDRPDLLNRMGQLMEGAYGRYRMMVPSVKPTTYPMQCYLFNTRPEWMDFTRRHTGRDSNIYLQITRGGYTLHDWYVAYYIGDIATYPWRRTRGGTSLLRGIFGAGSHRSWKRGSPARLRTWSGTVICRDSINP